MQKQQKSFGVALVLWFFLGGLGMHRVYVKEAPITFLWYWLATICTFGIIVLVDVFLIKGMIEKKYLEDNVQELVQQHVHDKNERQLEIEYQVKN